VLNSDAELDTPLTSEQRRAYGDELQELGKTDAMFGPLEPKDWAHVQTVAEPDLDSSGRPVAQVQLGDGVEQVGISRANVMAAAASGVMANELAAKLLQARIKQELRKDVAKKTSQQDVAADMILLQRILSAQIPAGTSLPARAAVAAEPDSLAHMSTASIGPASSGAPR
jgi:hypothetical protein